MIEKMVVGSDQMLNWLKKYNGIEREIRKQVLRELKNPGSGLSLDQLQLLVEHRNPFCSHDRVLGSMDDQIASWRQFYLNEFGIEFGPAEIPVSGSPFDRAVVVAEGITAQRVYDRCRKYFPCEKYTNRSLDEIVVHNDRSSQNGAYVIRIRERVEADEEFKNLSANQLKKKNHQGITLTERLLYGLKYLLETGKHLDIKNVTLCTGSRDDDGHVPRVHWCPGSRKMYVGWYGPDDASRVLLRSREVVS
jgi:hypothetical protein